MASALADFDEYLAMARRNSSEELRESMCEVCPFRNRRPNALRDALVAHEEHWPCHGDLLKRGESTLCRGRVNP